ncbi:MAG: metallophosphoesterase, partial [bacterium]|nr:metallophosphoesterase [bacterium]
TSMNATAAGIAPVAALLAGDVLYASFPESLRPRFSPAHAAAPILTSLVLIALPLASSLSIQTMPTLSWRMALACVVLAAGAAWTALSRLPRWSFAFLFLAAILLGRVLDIREPILELGETVGRYEAITLPQLLFYLAGALLLAALFSVWIGRRLRLSAQTDQTFQFGGETLRLFSPPRRAPEMVSTAQLAAVTPEAYSVVVFGDVTGAESPLHTRRGGYFAFRALARIIEEFRPRFAVSLGDLATQATRPAYTRVRKFLRDIPVPLAVTPGNHDVVFRERYNAAHFHALFGPDNVSFRVGSVRFLLLNNAWGAVGEDQITWLEKILHEDTSPFRLVFCHKPLFDPRDDECYAMEVREHAERLHELFRVHSVTAVFSGHIHSLSAHVRDGVTYIVSGGAGSRPVDDEIPYHYLWIDASRSSLTVRALPLSGAARGRPATPLLELHLSPRT